jgi:hypothetical protein
MEFLESIFGAQGSKIVWWLIAFVIVLVLAVVVLRGLRALMGTRLNMSERGAGRGRAPRLGVTEFFNLDRQGRRLVIVRRDNVEHLVLIGGPNDVLIESSIQRGERAAPRIESRESPRFDEALPPLPEPVPTTRPLPTHEFSEAPAAAEPRFEPPAISEPRIPTPPAVNDRTPVGDVPRDHLAQRLDEVLRKPLPPRPSEPPAKSAFEDALRAKAPLAETNVPEVKAPEPPAKPASRLPDLLADVLKPRSMATPTMPAPAPAAPAPSAAPPAPPHPSAPMSVSLSPAAKSAPDQPPAKASPPAPAPAGAPTAKSPTTAPAASPASKNPFDSLEEEMAKLLGRGLGDKL